MAHDTNTCSFFKWIFGKLFSDTLRFMISFVLLLKKIMQGFPRFYGSDRNYFFNLYTQKRLKGA